MYNISLDRLAESMSLAYTGPKGIVPKRVVFDSRQVQPGDLFVAIRGEHVDGHSFLDKAFAQGAVGAVVDADHVFDDGLHGCLTAADGVAFIQDLARWMRSRFQGPVLAVTGSQGKTSTKDLLTQVCGVSHNVVTTYENQNTEIGMPLTLTRLNEETDILIVEMGMMDFGEIDFLCDIARPTNGIITGIGTVHAEFLGSRQGIARAKSEMFRYLPEKGTVALRAKDQEILSPYINECQARVIWCDGSGQSGNVQAQDVVLETEGSHFTYVSDGKELAISLPFAGQHFVDNALLVIATAQAIDISNEDIQNGLAGARSLTSNRMELQNIDGGRLLINDCYNANPDSVSATLHVLAAYKPRPTVACLGNMGELGAYSESGHAAVGQTAAELGIDLLICFGDMAQGIGESAIAHGMDKAKVMNADTVKQAAVLLGEYAPEDAVILVKGSNYMHMVNIYKYLKAYFPELKDPAEK
jgi:UDP-N-acetylmuramoyl-tripeptide--D-alanyl-D-alanine ligase